MTDIKESEQIFLHDTPPHDNTPLYQVWLQMVQQFRTNCPDKIGYTGWMMDRRTNGHRDRQME